MAYGDNVVMASNDAISARLAECFMTIGGRRYNFMQMIDFEAKIEKTVATVSRLGTVMVGHKAVSQEGSWSGTAHYNQSVLREMTLDFKNTGVDEYFDIQISNNDPAADAGSQTVILYNCLTKSSILAKFDADGETLDEELEGTFDDYSIPESFTKLTGFGG